MENKKAYNKALIHILLCVIIVFIFVLTSLKVNALSKDTDLSTLKPYIKDTLLNINTENIIETNTTKYDTPRIVENNIYLFIEKYETTINFFANMFGFDIDFIKSDLLERNIDITEIDENNIGRLLNNKNELKVFPNEEYGISEYFFELSELYPEKTNNTIIKYTGNSEYIENLIIYYTNIYEDVDTILALSIGAAESGYYKVQYMLEKNNVYGGMGNNGLITYNNIEIGVLKYIRLLSNNYFKKGLTTKETIGRKYCPEINSDGEKVASSHWLNLVSKAESKYINYTNNITIEDIISD